MEFQATRPSNVAGMLLAGRYRYCSSDEDPGQVVDVMWKYGLPLVTVADGEDAGEVLDARTMPGTFTRIEWTAVTRAHRRRRRHSLGL